MCSVFSIRPNSAKPWASLVGRSPICSVVVDKSKTETIERDRKEVELKCISKATINKKEYNFTDNQSNTAYLENDMLYYMKNDIPYNDAVQVSHNVITLCDGAGKGSRNAATTAIETAHNAVSNKLDNVSTTHEALGVQLEAFKKASEAVEETGKSTTFIQAAFNGDTVTGVSLGDCGAVVCRRSKAGGGWNVINILGNTKGSLEGEDAGGLLGQGSNVDRVHAFAFKLEPGDVFYCASDGVFDNLDPHENRIPPNAIEDSKIESAEWDVKNKDHIELALKTSNKKFEEVIKDCENGKEIADAISNFVQENTKVKKLLFLISPNPTEAKSMKGKLDDAASAYYEYNPNPM